MTEVVAGVALATAYLIFMDILSFHKLEFSRARGWQLFCVDIYNVEIFSDMTYNSPCTWGWLPQKSTQPSPALALDESLYSLTEEGRAFFKQQTGIPDDDELKAHILRVQAEAYEVCILYP